MDRGETTISLLIIEIELMQTALAVVEMTFCKDNPENAGVLRVLRKKLLVASKKASLDHA